MFACKRKSIDVQPHHLKTLFLRLLYRFPQGKKGKYSLQAIVLQRWFWRIKNSKKIKSLITTKQSIKAQKYLTQTLILTFLKNEKIFQNSNYQNL